MSNISLKEIVGNGYNEFWAYKGRYRVVKGSRASKKSKTTALWYIYNMMEYENANTLIVRKTYRTLRDSCFNELKWAIDRLQVTDRWKITTSPLQMEYKPTGQKIYFRGLDDPLKVTSIASNVGSLCWLWIEEAYEITNEKDFDTLNESIRGEVKEPLFKQITITFNPWNEGHWLKNRFFDNKDPDTFSMTTNYLCNEFLDKSDLKMFEYMKEHNPRRYQVAGLGNWGISEGLIFERFIVKQFDLDEIRRIPNIKAVHGLDFGYANDPTAFFCGLCDIKSRKIYVYDEIYKKGMTNEMIYQEIEKRGYRKAKIRADSAEPKSIDRLYTLGLLNIRPARKGPDSVINGIDFLQGFEIIISPLCTNFVTEISNYTWQTDKFGKPINKPIDDFNHLIDAFRYSMEEVLNDNKFSFK